LHLLDPFDVREFYLFKLTATEDFF
jgi:hypothetical protein